MNMTITTPLVSIIIPTFNHRSYVCEAIDSCFLQTYSNIEVVVVDDGSTDGTGDMLREHYGDRIRYFYQNNQGLSAARNTAVQSANGEYIHLLDADDMLLPTKISRSIEVFQKNPEVVLVYTQCHFVEADGKTIIPKEQPDLPAGDIFCELLCGPRGDFIPQCTTLVKRQALLELGGFNVKLAAAEDWDMWLRLAARSPFGVVNEPLSLYRVLPSAMHTNRIRMQTARLQVIHLARYYPGRERCLSSIEYDHLEAGRHHSLSMALWAEGYRAEARQHLRSAISLEPKTSAIRRLNVLFTFFLSAQQARAITSFTLKLRSMLNRNLRKS